MNDNHKHHSRLDLEEIWDQVPPDYYQNGIKRNFLQYFWHTRKLKSIIDIVDIEPNNILDVGCASGWFLSEISLVYPKAKCTGVDVYKKAIDYGREEDWRFNGEDEIRYETFITEDALEQVIKVLKDYKLIDEVNLVNVAPVVGVISALPET